MLCYQNTSTLGCLGTYYSFWISSFRFLFAQIILFGVCTTAEIVSVYFVKSAIDLCVSFCLVCLELTAVICCDYRTRLQEGFHFIHTHHGILSLAIEFDMQVLCCALQI